MTLNVQLNYLDGKVKKKGKHPFILSRHADIWVGEFIDPNGKPPTIVIKIIRSSSSPEEAEKLKMKLFREAKVWTMLSHPNVVPLLGVTTAIEIAPTPGLVTPYYKNGCLKNYVFDDKHTLDLNDRMNLLYQVADALTYLHSQKPAVIHADIKPENILIDDGGKAVLADFGLSVVLETSGFTTKNIHGTIHYIAPELLLVEHSGPVRPTLATDVWAFGVTATEIFSRRQPYGIDHDSAIFEKVALKKETLKHEDYPEIRGGLWSGLMKCWKWNPEERVSIRMLGKFIRDKRITYAAGGTT